MGRVVAVAGGEVKEEVGGRGGVEEMEGEVCASQRLMRWLSCCS